VSTTVGLHWIRVSPCTISPIRPTHFTAMNLDGYEEKGTDSTTVRKENEDSRKGKGKDV
jgi:hypothetical protein